MGNKNFPSHSGETFYHAVEFLVTHEEIPIQENTH
jgi:hypothetical protein